MRMKSARRWSLRWLVAACVSSSAVMAPVMAQGVPVIDVAGLAQAVQQFEQMRSQLGVLNQQYQQAQQMYGSVNRLTSMGDIASVLQNPAVRRALPADFGAAEQALMGNGAGAFGSKADAIRGSNEVYSRDGANDFYSQELRRSQGQNAGQQSVASAMYEASTKRLDGIDQLRAKIGETADAAEKTDLQNRIATESAAIQIDIVKMQALAMIQQAQIQTRDQRAQEHFQKQIDDGVRSLGGTPGSANVSQ